MSIDIKTHPGILGIVFSHMDQPALAKMGRVCKTWNTLANAEKHWKALALKNPLFSSKTLEEGETWKKKCVLFSRWQSGKCSSEMLYTESENNELILDHEILRLTKQGNSGQYIHNLETNQTFKLDAPGWFEPHFSKEHIFDCASFDKELHVIHTKLDRKLRTSINKIKINVRRLHFGAPLIFLNEDFFVRKRKDWIQLWRINPKFKRLATITSGNFKCIYENLIFFQDNNKLCYYDLTSIKESSAVKSNEVIGSTQVNHRVVFCSKEQLVEISDQTNPQGQLELCVKRWNDYNQPPQEILLQELKYGILRLAYKNECCLHENIFVASTLNTHNKFVISAWDITTGKLLFTRKGKGVIKKLFAQSNRILAEIYDCPSDDNDDNKNKRKIPKGFLVYDFGSPTKIADPQALKQRIDISKKDPFKKIKPVLLRTIKLWLKLFIILSILNYVAPNLFGRVSK